MKGRKRPTIGIALGSGGAKGLAHIGVLKAFERHEIDIDFVAGTSFGALVGAYYAAHPNLSKLEELIVDFNRRKGFMLFDPVLRGGLLKGNKIEHFISDMLEGATFEKLRIPYAAISTDLNTAEEVVINHGDLVKAVRASISIPAVFQPIWHEDRLLADGGLSDPVPTLPVRAMGSDIVVAVNVESSYFPQQLLTIPSLSKIPMHSVNILRYNLTRQSLSTADSIIEPKTPPIGLIGWNYLFDTAKAQDIIKSGEDAAELVIPEIKALIEQKKKERKLRHRFFSFFKSLGR